MLEPQHFFVIAAVAGAAGLGLGIGVRLGWQGPEVLAHATVDVFTALGRRATRRLERWVILDGFPPECRVPVESILRRDHGLRGIHLLEATADMPCMITIGTRCYARRAARGLEAVGASVRVMTEAQWYVERDGG